VLTAYGPAVSKAVFELAPPNQITRLQTTLITPPYPPVPPNPGAARYAPALFIWPGLDPGTDSLNFLPINNGVLQPVLTWGKSCAPTEQPAAFTSWWISGQYVNTIGKEPGFIGCYSGNSMLVSPGDNLEIDMALDSTTNIWKQAITDLNTEQIVTFDISLEGQGQNLLYFLIETYSGASADCPVKFLDTTITFQSADTGNSCSISQGKNNQFVMTPPTPNTSATQCSIDAIVLSQATDRVRERVEDFRPLRSECQAAPVRSLRPPPR
jgi:hypothetical protein